MLKINRHLLVSKAAKAPEGVVNEKTEEEEEEEEDRESIKIIITTTRGKINIAMR